MSPGLMVQPSTRNLVWNLATSQFWSPEKLNRINPDNTPECNSCGLIANTHHVFFSCELSGYLTAFTLLALRASGFPLIARNEKNCFLVNISRGTMTKTHLQGAKAVMANTLQFRRALLHNPAIACSSTLLLKVFQDHHKISAKIFKKLSGHKYPEFFLNGKFSTIFLPFPRPLKSPIINNLPVYMKNHVKENQEKNACFDRFLEGLFPSTEQPKPKFSGERTISLRVLKTLILSSSKTKSTESEIETYLFKVASPDSNGGHQDQTHNQQPE